MQTRMEQDVRSGKEIPTRLTQTLRMLLKFGRVIIEATNEHQLLQSVCEFFVEKGGFRIAWVGYAESNSQKSIRLVAQAGDQDGILQNLNLTWGDADSKDTASVAIRTGDACCKQDSHVLSLPLKSDGIAFGALTLYADDLRQFDPDSAALLEEWSDLFAHDNQRFAENGCEPLTSFFR